MTLRFRWVALAVLAGLLICIVGYHHVNAAVTTLTITLNNNGGGNCTQTSSDGQSGVINVSQSTQSVTYSDGTSFSVGFSSCPFNVSCPITNGSPVAGQPMSNAVGNTYYYTSLTAGGGNCNNPGSMGLRIQP